MDVPADPAVNLGYGAALGYAPDELISPQEAASRDELPDTKIASTVTELRVHGVSGSTGPVMLEHPDVVQVAGDSTTRFYRRWSPGGGGQRTDGWKLEAYSWGGLTEKPLASAAWILLSPFMLLNVAAFALPAEERTAKDHLRLNRSRLRATTDAVLRLIALVATVLLTAALVAVMVNGYGFQAAQADYPSWMSWFAGMDTANRVRLATLGLVMVLAGLRLVSVITANRYEARRAGTNVALAGEWALTEPGFWQGQEVVQRQRSLHSAAALATVGFLLSRPGPHLSAARLLTLAGACLVLSGSAVLTALPLTDRHDVSLGAPGDSARNRSADPVAMPALPAQKAHASAGTWGCRAAFIAAAVVLIGAVALDWPQAPSGPGSFRGLINFCAIALAVQLGLAAFFAFLVWRLSTKSPDSGWPRPDGAGAPDNLSRADRTLPFFSGQLASLLVLLAIGLGGVFAASIALFLTRLVGTPVPKSALLEAPEHALQVPWPLYAFGLAPLGLLIGTLASAGYAFARYRGDQKAFASPVGSPSSPVAAYYGLDSVGASVARKTATTAAAKSWARGRIVDHVAVVVGCSTAGMLVAAALAAGETGRLSSDQVPRALHGFATADSVVGLFVAGLLVGLLRTAYSNPSRRRTIGALWDVATFWPRAVHPFAPPCYAERAVPELADRVRLLTQTVLPDNATSDPAAAQVVAHEFQGAAHDAFPSAAAIAASTHVLLTGYSQGSLIAPAVVAQLPDATVARVSLLTLACPLRRLYARAFPGYFGTAAFSQLKSLLCEEASAENESASPEPAEPEALRWRNLVRKSDYIGSWIYADPLEPMTDGTLRSGIDQRCPDPVVLAPDHDPTPPPTHAHSAFFQDPFSGRLARYLVEGLETLSALPPRSNDSGGGP